MKRIALLVFLSLALLGTWAVSHLQVASKSTSADVPPAAVGEIGAVPRQPHSDPDGDISARSPIPIIDMQESSGVAPTDAQAPKPTSVVDHPGDPESKESQWAREFAGLTTAELQKAAHSTEAEFQKLQSEAAFERHDLGLYDVVPSGKMSSRDSNSRELAVFQMGTGNELHRVALPEAEFPALYTMKQKAEWLRTQAVIASAVSHK
jgi:hypothetical protein